MRNIELKTEDFKTVDWQGIAAKDEEGLCDNLSSLFRHESNKQKEDGIDVASEILLFLSDITSMCLHPESLTDPYHPLVTFQDGSRSAIIDDFNDAQLDILTSLFDQVVHIDLKARFQDILWLRRKQYEHADGAIQSYLDSADHLLEKNSYAQAKNRLERALNLCTLLGKKYDKTTQVIEKIESLIESHKGDTTKFNFVYGLVRLLLEKQIGEAEKYAEICSTIAKELEDQNNFFLARDYWEIASTWYSLAKKDKERRQAQINNAELLVKQADSATSKMAASTHLIQAIEQYRRIGDSTARIEELHERLLKEERESLDEMQEFSTKIDLSKQIEYALNFIKDLSLHDALLNFALIIEPPKIQDLENNVKKSAEQSPLLHLIGAKIINKQGKIVGKKPTILASNPDEAEEAMNAEMFNAAEVGYFIDVRGIIEPARKRIMADHNVRISDLSFIVSNNPFIPDGHEYIFAQGLHFGFEGDFVSSIHFLIPQIENSIRVLLDQRGVPTSGLSSDGLQDEKTLSFLFEHEKTIEIFGEDLVFGLKTLLIEKYGSNIRNLVAHGLMEYYAFFQPNVIYLWWLIFRLCCWPLHISRKQSQEGATAKA